MVIGWIHVQLMISQCGNQLLESLTFFELQEQQAEQIPAAGSNTLEWQLADIRKAVGRMQVGFL